PLPGNSRDGGAKCARGKPTTEVLATRHDYTYFAFPNWSGTKSSDTEFMQYLLYVGAGPSLKTWPRWESQREQSTSTRTMLWEVSFRYQTLPLREGSKKLGHPQLLANFASDRNNLFPQTAQK